MIKHYFIPTKKNNFKAKLLKKSALITYIIVIIASNLLVGRLGLQKVSAAITVEDLVNLHNNERKKNGLAPLSLNPTLSLSANKKAIVMMEIDCWSHYCPDGTTPWKYFEEAGYKYIFAGENLAEGFSDVQAVMDAWMNSPSHRENILNANFTEIGFGFASGRYQGRDANQLVTVHFGTPLLNTKPTDDETITSQFYKINIKEPKQSEIINSSNFNVTGTVNPKGANLLFQVNDKQIGKVKANGVNFIYKSPLLKDGDYKMKVNLVNLDGEILKTEKRDIKIDGASPIILNADVKISKNNSQYTIEFESSSDTIEATFNNLFFNKKDKIWQIILADNYILSNDKHTIILSDYSGNKSTFDLTKEDFATEGEDDSIIVEVDSISNNIFATLLSSDVKIYISLFFIGYLLILFLLDYIVLSKTNMISDTSRKPHLNFGLFLILIFVMSIGSVSGNILNGINL